jgi:Outer membrane protein beta-barrel domain
MLKHCVHTLAVTIMISFATALAYAQSSDVPKFEVGGQFSFIRLRDLSESDTGAGLRVGYNVTPSLAVEGEFNYFPGDLTDYNRFFAAGLGLNPTFYSQNRTQGLFGVKYMALRGDKFAIGGKFRPGFVRFNGDSGALSSGAPVGCAGINSTFLVCQLAAGKTNFAMDLGGVFEYYPAGKLFTRFDVGATVIRFGPAAELPDGGNSTNLQLTAGIGVRF